MQKGVQVTCSSTSMPIKSSYSYHMTETKLNENSFFKKTKYACIIKQTSFKYFYVGAKTPIGKN